MLVYAGADAAGRPRRRSRSSPARDLRRGAGRPARARHRARCCPRAARGCCARWLEAGSIDELFLTLAPVLTGDPAAIRIVEGAALPAPVPLGLEWVLRAGGELFLQLRSVGSAGMKIEGAQRAGRGRGVRAGRGHRAAPARPAGRSVRIADLNAERGEALAAELGARRSSLRRHAGGPGRGRRGRPRAAAHLRLLRRRSAGPRRRPAGAAPHALEPFQTRDRDQPDRHVQRAAAGRRGDARATSPTRAASAA